MMLRPSCLAARYRESCVSSKSTYTKGMEDVIINAGVAELADGTDLKSVARNSLWVQPPSPAPYPDVSEWPKELVLKTSES